MKNAKNKKHFKIFHQIWRKTLDHTPNVVYILITFAKYGNTKGGKDIKTINYFDGQTVFEIEVNEDVAEYYSQLLKDEARQRKRVERHETVSLTQMEDEK